MEVIELEKYVCIAYTLLRGHSQFSPAKSHVMQERPNVFISATTADLGSYRLAVRDTLLDQGVHPILQNVTVQVVKTGIMPQRALSDRFREAETEPLLPARRLHMRR